LIIPVILAAQLRLLPVADTLWWNTVGAQVTEHRDQNGASCALTFLGNQGSVAFQWDSAGRTLLIARDQDWDFPDNPHMPVAVRVGDTWLSNGGNSAIIDAAADGRNITAGLSQPIDALLPDAGHVQVKTAANTLSISIDPWRLTNIVARLKRCQAVLGR
jgi:hypothetical protein